MSLITTKEAARRFNLSEVTLRIWRVKGIGPRHHVIGTRSIRYDENEIVSYLEANRRTSTSEALGRKWQI